MTRISDSLKLVTASTIILLGALSSCSKVPVEPIQQLEITTPTAHHTYLQKVRGDAVLSALQPFVIANQSSHLLGMVGLIDSTESFPISVGANETDTAELDFAPSSVVVNGQVCQYPDSTTFTLPDGAKVVGSWPDPHNIAIIDYRTQD